MTRRSGDRKTLELSRIIEDLYDNQSISKLWYQDLYDNKFLIFDLYLKGENERICNRGHMRESLEEEDWTYLDAALARTWRRVEAAARRRLRCSWKYGAAAAARSGRSLP